MAGKTTSGDLDAFKGKLVNVLVGLGDSATYYRGIFNAEKINGIWLDTSNGLVFVAFGSIIAIELVGGITQKNVT